MAVHLSGHINNSAAVTMLNQILEHLLSCVTQLLLIYVRMDWCQILQRECLCRCIHQQNPEVREEAGIFHPYQKALQSKESADMVVRRSEGKALQS